MGYAEPPYPRLPFDAALARSLAWQQQQAAYHYHSTAYRATLQQPLLVKPVPPVKPTASQSRSGVRRRRPKPRLDAILSRWAVALAGAGVPTRSHRWTYIEGQRRRELVGLFRKRLVEREFVETYREEGDETQPYFPAGQGTLPCPGGSYTVLVGLTRTMSVLRFRRYTAFVDWPDAPDMTTTGCVTTGLADYLCGSAGGWETSEVAGRRRFDQIVSGVSAYCRGVDKGAIALHLLESVCADEGVTAALTCRQCGADRGRDCDCLPKRRSRDEAGDLLKELRDSFGFTPERAGGHGVGRGAPRRSVTCHACREPAGRCACR